MTWLCDFINSIKKGENMKNDYEIGKYVEIGYVEIADEALSRILPRSDVADPLIQLVS